MWRELAFFQTVSEPGGILMDDIQKSRIRLKHWIDHNFEHIKGYEEVAQTLDNNNCGATAEMIRRGTRLIEDAEHGI